MGDLLGLASVNKPTTDDYIRAAMSQFKAKRGLKTIHAGGRAVEVHTAGERIIHLPNGHTVKVTTDDSGVATQIEEDEKLHAIVRPAPVRLRARPQLLVPTVSYQARPTPIRTTAKIRRNP